jgi:hypothetical protein
MLGIGRSNKLIVVDVHRLPEVFDPGDNPIDIGLRRNSCGFGHLFNLLAMFIGTG